MGFNQRNQKEKFSLVAFVLFAIFLLSGCLELPESPDVSKELKSLTVFAFQDGVADSSLLKIHPGKPSTLQAEVYPHQLKKELEFEWWRDSVVLGRGERFKIDSVELEERIPNVLKVRDALGGEMEIQFHLVVNTPPKMESATKPHEGDTLVGYAHTSFLFSWASSDKDASFGDRLLHTLVLDGLSIEVGELTRLYQSGFEPGEHSFSVIVTDSFGDSDTLSPVTFFVKLPEENP